MTSTLSTSNTSASLLAPASTLALKSPALPVLLVESSVEQGVNQTIGKSQQGQLIIMMMIIVMIFMTIMVNLL